VVTPATAAADCVAKSDPDQGGELNLRSPNFARVGVRDLHQLIRGHEGEGARIAQLIQPSEYPQRRRLGLEVGAVAPRHLPIGPVDAPEAEARHPHARRRIPATTLR